MCAFWGQPSAFTGFEITEPSPAHAFLSDFRGYLGLGFFVVAFVFVFPVDEADEQCTSQVSSPRNRLHCALHQVDQLN